MRSHEDLNLLIVLSLHKWDETYSNNALCTRACLNENAAQMVLVSHRIQITCLVNMYWKRRSIACSQCILASLNLSYTTLINFATILL